MGATLLSLGGLTAVAMTSGSGGRDQGSVPAADIRTVTIQQTVRRYQHLGAGGYSAGTSTQGKAVFAVGHGSGTAVKTRASGSQDRLRHRRRKISRREIGPERDPPHQDQGTRRHRSALHISRHQAQRHEDLGLERHARRPPRRQTRPPSPAAAAAKQPARPRQRPRRPRPNRAARQRPGAAKAPAAGPRRRRRRRRNRAAPPPAGKQAPAGGPAANTRKARTTGMATTDRAATRRARQGPRSVILTSVALFATMMLFLAGRVAAGTDPVLGPPRRCGPGAAGDRAPRPSDGDRRDHHPRPQPSAGDRRAGDRVPDLERPRSPGHQELMSEHDLSFPCMGCEFRLLIGEPTEPGLPAAEEVAEQARALLQACDSRLSRFKDSSDLVALNSAPAEAVPAKPLLDQVRRGRAVGGGADGRTCRPDARRRDRGRGLPQLARGRRADPAA